MSEVTELDYADMNDEQFEAALSEDNFSDTEQEAPSEPLDVSEDEVDESPEEELDSTEEASTEPEDTNTTEEVEDEEDETEEEESDETDEPQEDSEPSPLDELYQPFKASGREVSVKSIEEAKKLMSMGVDYSVKLKGFKQHRGTIKTLQKNEIDENTLNYLIDLKNGDSNAINKLLKDHKVDPYELNVEEDLSYKPKDHSVSPNQVELDDVVDRIQSSATFSTTTDIVTNQWDDASQNAVSKNPNILAWIDEHVSNGTYDRVMKEVERARIFGGLDGLSDLEAYDKVGAQLFAQSQTAPVKQVATAPKQKPNTDRKRKASPSKRTSKATQQTKNFADMNDEEFEKLLEDI